MICKACDKPLVGRQTKFCSRLCKSRISNESYQTYSAQKERGLERKKRLIDLKGGKCSSCGYRKNYAALCFHHRDGKDFGLTARECANNKWEVLLAEVEKCVLLCHNCHMEEHHPELNIE